MKKNTYTKPIAKVTFVNIEEGIAQSSASFAPGGINNEPEVEDWIEIPSTNNPTWEFDNF